MNASPMFSFAPYTVIQEPSLEFGSATRGHPLSCDPQVGLSKYGPYSSRLGGRWHPKRVRLVPLTAESDFEMVCDTLSRLAEFERSAEPSADGTHIKGHACAQLE